MYKPVLKAPTSMLSALESSRYSHKLLSTFDFNVNLRRCTEGGEI